jgi:proline dehydrogenase
MVLRAGLLWLSEQRGIFSFIRGNRLARRLASRFVAGETVEAAVAALPELNAAGISASLDLLGESVTSAAEACAARDTYLETLDRIRQAGADSNVSVKLTQMGLDLDERLCVENMRAIIAKAQRYGSFVRIDMEQSAYTETTLRLFRRTFHPEFGTTVGVVLQSYLRRTEQDLEEMIALGARVRLCKGAYQEPPGVAFPDKRDVDANYIRCMERLLERGNYPGIATHDAKIIAHAKDFARRTGVAPQRFEFQMLYGVRRDLQQGLRRAGYNVRVYVPFGSQWYPYLMRRLAERPANIAFLLGNVVRESLRRS